MCPYPPPLTTKRTLSSATSCSPWERVDHLLVAAFVEARSCERLRLLATELTATPSGSGNAAAATDLQEFYSRLAEAEARHWVLFHELAAGCTPEKRLNRRMNELAAMESDIMDSLPHAARMH